MAAPGALAVRYEKADKDSELEYFAISGGIIEINPKSIRVLVDEADHGDDIIEAESKAALTRALKLRDEAKEIVTTAKEEATTMVADAEAKGKANAEHIVAEAHDEIAKEVVAAKKALHNETIELVAQATEKIVGTTVDAKVDAKVITSALEGGK
jgi:F0F1-type ATP synthase membrane subunit b/b'